MQAELEDKERKHFRTKGGSDFEGTPATMYLLVFLLVSNRLSSGARSCSDWSVAIMQCSQTHVAAEQRQADLKLLEAPDIGTGVGGKPKVLVPKAVDADEEGEDDDDSDVESSDEEVLHCRFQVNC